MSNSPFSSEPSYQPSMRRLCSINVDLDEIPNYLAIHGLESSSLTETSAHAVYDVAVPRLLSFAKAAGIPLTLFAVGHDLTRPEAGRLLHKARNLGHALGNHSFSHWYDLSRRGPAAIQNDIDQASTVLREQTGASAKGFRAPGYTITDQMFGILRELGFTYDSSVFPCPAYMAAKNLAIAMYGLTGKPSRSIADHPQVLAAPTRPYLVGKPYWRRGDGLLELPIQVTPGLRLPFIGTSLMMLGPNGAKLLTRTLVKESFVNIELHGIDVLDSHDADLGFLARRQRDLHVRRQTKLDVLDAVVQTLRGAGFSFVTLDEAAEVFANEERRN